jgi:hypothetical protein
MSIPNELPLGTDGSVPVEAEGNGAVESDDAGVRDGAGVASEAPAAPGN